MSANLQNGGRLLSRGHLMFLCVVVLVVIGVIPQAGAQDAAQVTITGRVLKPYLWSSNTITLRVEHPAESVLLTCADPTCSSTLLHAQTGYAVTATVDRAGSTTSINSVHSVARPVGAWPRVIAYGASLLVLFFAAAAATGWPPWRLIVGADNRYSNSQFQIVLWFGAVATMYLGTLALRVLYLGWGYLGGIGITANVAAVTGLSALSFGGAKTITMTKIQSAEQAHLPPVKSRADVPRFRSDLFMNDKEVPDFGDFQMILITILAVAIFVGEAFHAGGLLALKPTIKLPDIDTSLLAGFGIGHGAYLVKKAVSKAGDG